MTLKGAGNMLGRTARALASHRTPPPLPRSFDKAAIWGYLQACVDLGIMLERAIGVLQNYANSIAILSPACTTAAIRRVSHWPQSSARTTLV